MAHKSKEQIKDLGREVIDERSNDGKVKINDGGGVKPSYTLIADTDQIIDYGSSALTISPDPTTEWPQNIISPTDSDIWLSGTTTFIENPILGQSHLWRIILDYSGKSINDVVGISVVFKNTLSGFESKSTIILPEGRTSDTDQQAIIFSIADAASLPSPYGTGEGYQLIINSNKALDIIINSVARISGHHNKR